MADSPRIEELRRRVQTDPASTVFAALAEEYRRTGRFHEAVGTCVAGLKRHPSYLSAHITHGRALIELGQYDDAWEALQFVLRAAPENLAAIRGLAEIHQLRGADADPSVADPLECPPAAPVPPVPMPLQMAPFPRQADNRIIALEGFLEAVRLSREPGSGSTR